MQKRRITCFVSLQVPAYMLRLVVLHRFIYFSIFLYIALSGVLLGRKKTRGFSLKVNLIPRRSASGSFVWHWTQANITALFQELLPGTPIDRFEMDRVHRALAPRKINGPPRDIIAKLHFYRTKEQILTAARGRESLSFQGNTYQLFTDLSPLTVAKRRALKPQLQVLQRNQISYQWGFPFCLRFTHLETKYVCRSSEDLKSALFDMGLAEAILPNDQSHRRSAFRSTQQNKDPKPSYSTSSHQNLNKRGRYEHSPPNNEDSMDWQSKPD